jgi:hypothetical protein
MWTTLLGYHFFEYELFYIYNLFTQRKEKYNADMSLQERRQEMNMVDWL